MLIIVVGGCSESATEEPSTLREGLTKAPKFDINNVPEKDRAIVEAMTKGRTGAPPTPSGK